MDMFLKLALNLLGKDFLQIDNNNNNLATWDRKIKFM